MGPSHPSIRVTLAVLAACSLVATIALVSGAPVTVRAARVTPHVTEEVLETRGIVTVPVRRVVDAGRVDAAVSPGWRDTRG